MKQQNAARLAKGSMHKQIIKNTLDDVSNFSQWFRRKVLENVIQQEYNRDMAEYILLELLNNAWEHGNRSAVDKNITVEWSNDAEMLYISVEDQGEGFIPDIPQNPPRLGVLRGRGLWSIREEAFSLSFNKKGNKSSVSILLRSEK